MKPVSMWVTLGMSLFLPLSTGAIAADKAAYNPIPIQAVPPSATPPGSTGTSPLTGDPPLGFAIVVPSPNPQSTVTAIGPQPEPPEIFNANAVSQDPMARAKPPAGVPNNHAILSDDLF